MSVTLSASWTRDMASSGRIDVHRCIDGDRYIDRCQWEAQDMGKRGSVLEVAAADECCPSVLAARLDETQAAELAKGFAALGDPVRLRVLSMLAAAPTGEVCVCEFVDPL